MRSRYLAINRWVHACRRRRRPDFCTTALLLLGTVVVGPEIGGQVECKLHSAGMSSIRKHQRSCALDSREQFGRLPRR